MKMSYNKNNYNTRFSGRYSSTGQFVSGGEQASRKQASKNMPPMQAPPEIQLPNEEEDVGMAPEVETGVKDGTAQNNGRPHWMKNKLSGVKKVSNRERRRRQNENLRRLLTPKNALMVLNEMMPNEQVASQFRVEPTAMSKYNSFKAPNTHTFCADLTVQGNDYKGYGDNKLMARNAAAEQAIRDLIIKKMNKTINNDSGSVSGGEAVDEEALPMLQLASFALHKLFTEWEFEGHKVPQLKPNNIISQLPCTGGTATVAARLLALAQNKRQAPPLAEERKARPLPANASNMHPAMLLTYMRPHLEYRELGTEGDRPQNMSFTMSVEVDGATYIGKASNKKEARKAAAKAACSAVFNIKFDEDASANTPTPTPKPN